MSNDDKQASTQAVPFFARYLEGQFCEDLSDEETEAVRGGIADGGGGIVTTLKFPSDNEDGSHGTTRKYPSDADEASYTNKYPSDGDDRACPID